MAEYRVQLSPAQIDAFLRSQEQFRVSGLPVPLGELVMRAAAPIAQSVVSEVMRHAQDIRLWDKVLLVGGGALLFQGVLAAELVVPVRLPKEPAYANAGGYFRRRLEELLAGGE